MSEESLRVTRGLLAAFKDGFDLAAASRYWDPAINWRAMEGALDDVGEFSGHDAMRTYYQQWIDTFDEMSAEPEQLIDRGEAVAASLHMTGRMKGSDAVVEMRFAVVCWVRGGLVVKGREFATLEEALAATEAA